MLAPTRTSAEPSLAPPLKQTISPALLLLSDDDGSYPPVRPDRLSTNDSFMNHHDVLSINLQRLSNDQRSNLKSSKTLMIPEGGRDMCWARWAYGSRVISTSLPLHQTTAVHGCPAYLTALAGNEGGQKGREKRKKGKGKGRLSASPAYAGEVGGIGDDSGVFVSRKQGSDLKRPA